MDEMKETIAAKIKEARIERDFRQKEVAERLGKTTGAISQMEQGSSQVSALDLYELALMFNKPIEYFYGEEYMGDDVQALVALIRKMSPEERENQIGVTMMILQMQGIADTLKETDDQEIQEDLARTFYKAFVPFSVTVNQMADQINEIKAKLEGVLEIEKLDTGEE